MNVVIFGATGMVGQGALRECLVDRRVGRVVTVARKATGQRDAKLTEIVLADLSAIASIEGSLAGMDACLFCLGVSSAGMSEPDYTRVTYELTLRIATLLARLNPGMTFVYVSGAGTDRASRFMWARVKARTEDALLQLPFKAAYMLRPAMIQPLHGIRSKTGWYRVLYAATEPLFAPLLRAFPGAVTSTERLGRAMIAVAAEGSDVSVLDNAAINQRAR